MIKIFKNREAAGKLLAQRLKDIKADLVLGIPRGGVVVAAEVAHELKLPLDILVVRKIGAPFQKELALGAVDPDGEVLWEQELIDDLGLKINDLKDEIQIQREEIRRREDAYRNGKSPLEVENKIVILVDDGIATGATTQAAINYLKRHQVKKIILAVPVSSKDAIDKMVGEIGDMGEVIVLETPEYFEAVGQFYQDFPQVSDEEVVQLLNKS